MPKNMRTKETLKFFTQHIVKRTNYRKFRKTKFTEYSSNERDQRINHYKTKSRKFFLSKITFLKDIVLFYRISKKAKNIFKICCLFLCICFFFF